MTTAVRNIRQHTVSVPSLDWRRISQVLLQSRAIDTIEETELVPAKLVFNQFSARGHDLAQIILGSLLTHPHDAATGYYRSRPFVMTLGLELEDAIAPCMAKAGGYSDGRDIGVVCNYPNPKRNGAMLFPMCGGVGAQYSPIAGWAQSIRYHLDVLGDESYRGAIGVSMGGDSSMSTSGFWAALNISTTNKLPHLFFIEDNGYGISVPQTVQTPGGDQVANLTAYRNLKIIDGDGTDPEVTPRLIQEAVEHTRSGAGPCLLRLKVPRLCGHTFQDTQTYKPEELIESEQARDPLPKLRRYLAKHKIISDSEWEQLEADVFEEVRAAVESAKQRPEPDTSRVTRYVYAETGFDGKPDLQIRGGLATTDYQPDTGTETPAPSGPRLNMLTAIRKTLDHELAINKRMLVFGEDVGPKGGVHGATLGLNEKHGNDRVFDTSLSEEGIIGRSVGMALSGLLPVPEIQFRKYAEPAAEQLSDTGIMRWRTNNQFAAPMVVRIPGGYAKRGDPWHSMSDEVEWVHKVGWQVAMPSNAEDAVGLLRYALRDNNPTIFFEHRALLDNSWARRPYPGDDFVLPFGKARTLISGSKLTVVTWGAMVERCESAIADYNIQNNISADDHEAAHIELIDLRTLKPWDKDCILESVKRTGRCLIVHEDNRSAGFGAEIAAVLSDEAFFYLDAPIARITMPDIPSPHNLKLLDAALPSADQIVAKMNDLITI
ncbi:alpha-ketoacid dehydrogenase subunit alpha/beta [Pseudohongiella spirulinae]|uniref:3-methyl-2-oxobutanoate dehydrogenase (2-methylpropanoyl-transferring) n=1 Tax=Pseudohongiella spirulinae TaxID=1249552 RepID=A0A0S2KGG9_9GAMM|nr:thiamine pyrophosphate-dependent enzyme [Pseudohongiella spirulinae]ALO47420.1 2-oxoisovalerate dehydrogenase subunit beta [Pseudohongiella spirulinae]